MRRKRFRVRAEMGSASKRLECSRIDEGKAIEMQNRYAMAEHRASVGRSPCSTLLMS